MRKLVLSMVALATIASAAPAALADETGANAGYAGTVLIDETVEVATLGPVRLVADCTFAGALTPANTLIIGYGGSAVVRGPQNNAVPLATAVGCEIRNSTESQYKDVVLPTGASSVADSTALATDGPKEWAVEPVTICVTAFAVFGPFPVTEARVNLTCKTPDGR